MKKLIFLLACVVAFLTAQAQGIRISNLQQYSGNPSGHWIPISVNDITYKINAGTLGYSKLDTVYSRNDSLFGKKYGTEFFVTVLSAGGGTQSLNETQIAFGDAGNLITSSSNLAYDPVNKIFRSQFNGGDDQIYLDGTNHQLYIYVNDQSSYHQSPNSFTFSSGSFTIGNLAGNGNGIVAVDNEGLFSWASPNTNTSIGGGYRVAVNATNNIKSIFAGSGLIIDSTTHANAITLSVAGTGTDTILVFHSDTIYANKKLVIPKKDTSTFTHAKAQLDYQPSDNHFYGDNGTKWLCLDCMTDTTAMHAELVQIISQQAANTSAIATKLAITDTALINAEIVQLRNGKLNIGDTSLINAEIVQLRNGKLNIGDTSLINAEIVQLRNGKLNIGDTSLINAEIVQLRNGKLNIGDTSIINAEIVQLRNGKLNIGDTSAINAEIVQLRNGKQDLLVSGTNIKTVNGNSLLGSGDVSVSGGGATTDTLRTSHNPIKIFNQTYFTGTTNFNVAGTPTVAYTNGAVRLSSALNVGFTKYFSVANLSTNDDQCVRGALIKIDSLGAFWVAAKSINTWLPASVYFKVNTSANTIGYYYPDTSTLVSTTNLDFTIALNDVLHAVIQEQGKSISFTCIDLTQKSQTNAAKTVVDNCYTPNSNDFAFGCSQGVIEVQQVNISSYAIRDAYVTFCTTSKGVTTATPIQYPRAAALGSTNINGGNSDDDGTMLSDTNYYKKIGSVYYVKEANRNGQARGLSAQQVTTDDSLLTEALKRISSTGVVWHLLPQNEDSSAGGQNQTALRANIISKYAAYIIDPNTNTNITSDLAADKIHGSLYGAAKWADNIHNSGKIVIRNESSYNTNQVLAQRIVNSQWDAITGGINYSGGLVGIGIASPQEQLHVGSTANVPTARFDALSPSQNTNQYGGSAVFFYPNQSMIIGKTNIGISGTPVSAGDAYIYNDNNGDITLTSSSTSGGRGIGIYPGLNTTPVFYANANDQRGYMGWKTSGVNVGARLNVNGVIYASQTFALGALVSAGGTTFNNPAGINLITNGGTETLPTASSYPLWQVTFKNISGGSITVANVASGEPTTIADKGAITYQSISVSGTYSWYAIASF